MSDMNSDPIRLADDPSSAPALRSDLGTASNAQLTGLNVAGGLSALQAAVASEAAKTGVLAPVAAGGLSTAAKAVLAGVVLLGGAGLWVGLSDDGAPSPAPTVASASTPSVSATPTADAPVAIEPAAAPAPAKAPAAAVVPDEEVAEDLPAEVPEAEVAVEPAPTRATAKPRRKAAPLTAEDALAEAGLISRAKKALATSPAEALSLTNEAKRDFPRGMLSEEREAIAIQALAKLGRHDKAQRRGERFLKAHGRGPHASSVRKALDALP